MSNFHTGLIFIDSDAPLASLLSYYMMFCLMTCVYNDSFCDRSFITDNSATISFWILFPHQLFLRGCHILIHSPPCHPYTEMWWSGLLPGKKGFCLTVASILGFSRQTMSIFLLVPVAYNLRSLMVSVVISKKTKIPTYKDLFQKSNLGRCSKNAIFQFWPWLLILNQFLRLNEFTNKTIYDPIFPSWCFGVNVLLWSGHFVVVF